MLKSIFFFSAVFFFQGCLIFNKVAYEIRLNGATDGTASIVIHNIRSDAQTELTFEEDKHNLFEFALKSDEFVKQLESEGKQLIDRELFVANGVLSGKIVYNFQDISRVENITFENGFYYLQLTPEDSVISTNGEILAADKKKMIMWDRSHTMLQFELFSTSFPDETTSRELLPFLK